MPTAMARLGQAQRTGAGAGEGVAPVTVGPCGACWRVEAGAAFDAPGPGADPASAGADATGRNQGNRPSGPDASMPWRTPAQIRRGVPGSVPLDQARPSTRCPPPWHGWGRRNERALARLKKKTGRHSKR